MKKRAYSKALVVCKVVVESVLVVALFFFNLFVGVAGLKAFNSLLEEGMQVNALAAAFVIVGFVVWIFLPIFLWRFTRMRDENG